jgi:hypothetical protein
LRTDAGLTAIGCAVRSAVGTVTAAHSIAMPTARYHRDLPRGPRRDDMFRWYDYRLKSIDTGVVDEPAVNIFVERVRRSGRTTGRSRRSTASPLTCVRAASSR